MSDPRPAEMEIEGPKRSVWRNLSLVWLVPFAALAVTLFIAWQSWAERGTRIEIRFENAAGVVPDETAIRYRDVSVGFVEDVEFSSDLASVLVHARIDNTVAGSLPADAQFWVVRPEVSASGISGLSTVLSGVYIEAAFEPQTGAGATAFEGLNETPLVKPGMKGTRIVLRASDGTMLTAGAPIFHQGIEVGRIETPRLLDSGKGVIVDAFIDAPNDRRITTATRFWDTSGFDVNVGPSGINLSVGSVAALIRGGIAFDTVFSGGSPVPSRYVFDLFGDEASARDSVFSESIDNAVDLVVEFDESVRGLEAGSPVTYRGLKVGSVMALGAFIEEVQGQQRVKLRASISIDPRALGLSPDAPQAQTIAFLAEAVQNGLRARLAAEGLFSQALMVELAEIPDAAPAALGIFDTEAPVIPSVASDLPDVAATAEGLFQRIDNLPVEELMDQAIATLASIENLAGDENLRSAPGAFTALLDDARGLIGGEAAQALPGELTAAVSELRGIAEDLRRADMVGKLVETLESASAATDTVSAVADAFSEATGEVPDLISDLRGLTAKANEMELDAFIEKATALLDSADRLIDSDAARGLPGSLSEMLDEARAALAELREGGVVESTNATLASARDAAAAIEEAAQSLPRLSTRIERLVAEAETALQGYGANSSFNRETVAALRDVREAAAALTKLARAIERNPNSLLFGR
ncbi:MlaD family protein [Salipiger sp. P9]|uniref:MlaD family protein n=1 Tax=Salipiger pentaromativorans TaxID=2943193 RepID=UPI0021587547|nr:MlaD family protein [Salipiger pentaromativorans]MCR8546238.1 MlaD family protein [Salipiger pentaromativorans]